MGPRPNTQRHNAFDSFFIYVIFYVILHFKINIIIPNSFSRQRTIPRPRPSFKTLYKDRDFRHQDQDQDFQNTVSRPRSKSRELRVWWFVAYWKLCHRQWPWVTLKVISNSDVCVLTVEHI